tara:strand:+ start:272 stop:745 length:474 start_codon:yes stop_codon:yes gene_type:complete
MASEIRGSDNFDTGNAGKVLQVVQDIQSGVVSTTATSMTAFGTGATITPSSATSKVLVTITASLSGSTGIQVPVSIFRDAVDLTSGTDNGMVEVLIANSTVTQAITVMKLDSPATTTAITYKLGVSGSSGTMYSGRRGDSTSWNKGAITITLVEVAA